MKAIFLALCVVCFSTSVFAGYCSDDRWWKNQRKQDEFVKEWGNKAATYVNHRDNFKKIKLIHRRYSASQMEAYCRNTPEDCQKMFEKNAVMIEDAMYMIKKDIQDFEAFFKTSEALIDEWHVLAGACYEQSSDNLKRGKENAADVRTDLQKMRQSLVEIQMIYFLYQQEMSLLQHIEKVLKKVKVEAENSYQVIPEDLLSPE